MKQIFGGYFLLLFSFHLTLNNQFRIELLPDFLGWLLLYRGMGELTAESGRFLAARPFAVGLGIYAALLWVGDLLGLSGAAGNFVGVGLGFVATLVSFYAYFLLVSGIRELEQARNADLRGKRLQQLWLVMLVGNLLAYFSFVFSAMAALCAVVAFAASVLFLVYLYRGWRSYEELPPLTSTEEA